MFTISILLNTEPSEEFALEKVEHSYRYTTVWATSCWNNSRATLAYTSWLGVSLILGESLSTISPLPHKIALY